MVNASLHRRIVRDLVEAGRNSPYAADANEPDPRYLGHGVRATRMRDLVASYRGEIRNLTEADKLDLATRLVRSGYGEQKTVALHVLRQIAGYFTPDRFGVLDGLMRGLHGWSKIDAFTGSLLPAVLERHPKEVVKLTEQWNSDSDLWMRRASVVLFTRKVARSGRYNDAALRLCENLKHDSEDMVRKGVGWSLKDLMRSDKKRVLEYVLSLRQQGVSSVVTLYALRDIKGSERARILGATPRPPSSSHLRQ